MGLTTLLSFGSAEAAVSCDKINAKGIGQDLGRAGTRARILGGGLLHGTTHGIFAVTGGPLRSSRSPARSTSPPLRRR
jgi:hypothetical protein